MYMPHYRTKFLNRLVQCLPTKEQQIRSKHFLNQLYFMSEKDTKSVPNYKYRYHLYKYHQHGGEVKKILYDNFEYKIDEDILEDGSWNIYLHNYYDDTARDCFQITKTDGKSTTVVIDNISLFPECVKKSAKKLTGSHILDFLLEYVKTNKKRLGVNKLVLTDNSALESDKCKNHIWLATIYVLTNGHTWYGKRGFRPCNSKTLEPDKKRIDLYNKNVKIMSKVKLSDINLKKILIDNELEYIYKNLIKYLVEQEEKDPLLKKVLKGVSLKDSCLLTHISLDLIKQLDLYDFQGKSFYLDI